MYILQCFHRGPVSQLLVYRFMTDHLHPQVGDILSDKSPFDPIRGPSPFYPHDISYIGRLLVIGVNPIMITKSRYLPPIVSHYTPWYSIKKSPVSPHRIVIFPLKLPKCHHVRRFHNHCITIDPPRDPGSAPDHESARLHWWDPPDSQCASDGWNMWL